VSRETVVPVSVEPVGDLMEALAAAGAELRIMPSLWPLYDAVIASTLDFSIIRWRNASPRPEEGGRSGGRESSGVGPQPNPLPEGEGMRGQILSQADGKECNHPLAVQEELLRSLQDGTRGTGRQTFTISEVAEWAGGET
jgi:hypothetical protein